MATNPLKHPRSDGQSHKAADKGERDALGEQLAGQAPPTRAQGHAGFHFLLPLSRSREQQIGNVGAGDEQHQSHGCHQHHQRRLHVAHGLFEKRMQDDSEPVFLVGVGLMLFDDGSAHPIHVRLHLGKESPGLMRPSTS